MEKENYENIISLLKQTLEFYADENTYSQSESENEAIVKIFNDRGVYAKKTLKLVDDLEKSIESYENDYDQYIKNAEEYINSTEEVNNIINKIKNIKNNGNKI